MAGQFYAMESGVLCQCFNSTRKLPDGVGHSTSSHLQVCQMPSATLPDNLQLETIPEPANIVRHRCLKKKKEKYNRRGACDTQYSIATST